MTSEGEAIKSGQIHRGESEGVRRGNPNGMRAGNPHGMRPGNPDGTRPGNPNWAPGVSGNPAGRPKGARNKATVILQALLENDAEAIGRAAVALAKTGNLTALRLCLARLAPPGRDRRVAFDLPSIHTLDDAFRAQAALLDAVAAGELSPSEAGELGRLVDSAAGKLREMEGSKERFPPSNT